MTMQAISKVFRNMLSTDPLTHAIVALAGLCRSHRDLLFSLAITLVFYWPALLHGSRNAGFLYTGDVLGAYVPLLAKTCDLLSHYHFTALDYSSFNGSSDFFMSPSSHSYHPLVVVYSLFLHTKSSDIHDVMRLLVVLLATSTFCACYYTIRLCRKDLGLSFPLAALVGILFSCSAYMAKSTNQPSFLLSAAPLPWCVYAALRFSDRPTPRNLLFGALPIVVCLLSSYVPLGVACVGLAAVLVLCLSFINNPNANIQENIRAVTRAAVPFLCGSLVVGPYLVAVFSFYQETPAAHSTSLFFSAHQMAELPRGFLRVISPRLHVNGPLIEFSMDWGIPTLVVMYIFIFGRKTLAALSGKEWAVLKTCAVIYVLITLSIYGEHSVVSDIVYYFVPQVGTMHIYQRFLLPAQFALAVATALMLKSVLHSRPVAAIRVTVLVLGLGTLAAAYSLSHAPVAAASAGVTDYLVFELLVGTLFCATLLMPGRTFIYSCAIVLLALPSFDKMHDLCHGANTFDEQRQIKPLALDPATRSQITEFMQRGQAKATVRVVDVTPLWTPKGIETFPKGFSLTTVNEAQICSYSGFMFYLGGRKEYMQHMPIGADVVVQPDWNYILETGVDFVVARGTDLANISFLKAAAGKVRQEDVLSLPGDVKILSLRKEVQMHMEGRNIAFDNGYFRIGPAVNTARPELENVATLGTATQSSTFGGAVAARAIDGDTNGDFGAGAASSTDQDLHAWLDIDLGSERNVRGIRIWNRTDGSQTRLRDFWVFISSQPFQAAETAATLASREGVWARQVYATPMPSVEVPAPVVRGRYVRVQRNGDQPLNQSYLTLAEVEVLEATNDSTVVSTASPQVPLTVDVSRFHTNAANACGIEFESSAPTTVSYLFWNNPRLAFTLNGRRAAPVEQDGVWSIQSPAGNNRIEVRYNHPLLNVFWILYATYAAALAVGCIAVTWHRAARRLRAIRGGFGRCGPRGARDLFPSASALP